MPELGILPAQPRQHPRVGAQGIAIEARGPRRLQPLEITALGLLDAARQVQRPAAGAIRQLQQGPAVVDQLEAVPQTGEGGMFQPGGAQQEPGVAGLLGRRSCWRWLSYGGGWWALAAGGIRAIARGRG